MAAMSAAQLLDELMGRDRNLGPQDKREDLNWADSQVCKHFLVRFCPHELFTNTKADLGPCEKIHDERIRDAYKKSNKCESMGYEEDFVRFSQSMISDVERRIKRGRQRLSLTQQENAQPRVNQAKDSEEKVMMLTEKINSLLEQVETLGCEGKVEEAQGVMKLCEQLKEDRETLRMGGDPAQGDYSNVVEKQMEVCEVCGAFLIVGDAQQRLDDHLMGKQHCGYAMLRTTMEEVMANVQKKKDDKERLRESEREERRRKRDDEIKPRDDRRRTFDDDDRRRRPPRDDFRRRSRSPPNRGRDKFPRYGNNARDRNRRSRSRDRIRRGFGRDRRRTHRSRSRERNHRSRSKSSDRRHRSRSKSPDRRHRSRSRSRDKRRSRSRGKNRSRSREKTRSKSKDRKIRSRDASRSRSRDRKSKSASRERSLSREHKVDHDSSTKDNDNAYENGESDAAQQN